MSAEQEQSREYPVDAIHYYPKERKWVIDVEGGLTFSLRQAPEGLLAQLLLNQTVSQRAAVLRDDVVPAAEQLPSDLTPAVQPGAASESDTLSAEAVSQPDREQLILTGRLKSQPKEGRPDQKGRPTAWSHLAAHLKDSESAAMLSTSYHGATRAIALTLNTGDKITVEGYYKPNSDPQRMGFFSVFRFLGYPGMPKRTTEP